MKRVLKEKAVGSEQISSQGLALFIDNGRIVLYDPNSMLRTIQSQDSEQSYSERDAALANSIYGYLQLVDVPRGRAWDSSMVRQSAARKGYGPFVYDVAMTIAGSIVADRDKVSPDAEKVWQVYNTRQDITKHPLDDITDPKTPPEEDDADIHPGRDALNMAYSGARVNVASLQQNHTKFVQQAKALYNGDEAMVSDALETAADSFFRRMYR